jgi:hypothetical protein
MAEAFDCVEIKRAAQADLLAAFEARRDSFASYAEFIRMTAAEDPEVRAFKDRVTQARSEPAGDTTPDAAHVSR